MGGLKFVGAPGQFVAGIPARDLTAEEVDQHPGAATSRLYERVDAPEPKAKPRATSARSKNRVTEPLHQEQESED